MSRKIIGLILAGLVIFSLSGCSSTKVARKSYVRENANLSLIRTVAVLPFEGRGRAARIREMTMTQLLELDMFDLVDKARVDVFLKQEALRPGEPLDAFTLRRLGESLDVDAALMGSVEQSSGRRGSAQFPEITMTMRLVDCQSGDLLWQASGRGSGYSLADRLFGFAPRDSFMVIMDLTRELFATMYPEED